jgi:hydrogenase/urease accessory protein HupE
MCRLRSSALLALALVGFLWPRAAWAHAVGLSRGEYVVSDGTVSSDITFARGEVAGLVPALDPDKNGTIEEADVARARGDLEATVLGGFLLERDGRPCTPRLEGASLTEQDGLLVHGVYDCGKSSGASKVTLRMKLLEELSHGHRHIARMQAGTVTVEGVLYRGHDTLEIDAPPSPSPSPSSSPSPSPSNRAAGPGFLAFLRMGIEHILTGYDHLVFLFGLILVGGRVRSLVGVVTAFTVAHSITLALAALDVWSPPPRVIEPAIALSIAYIGFENFFVKSAEKRWRITFPFGLVHGFGFAGALREIELPRAQIPVALVSFNLGVEVGQLAVMAIVLPVVLFLRKREWFKSRAVKVLSVAVTGAGVVWFVERVIHPA